MADSRLRGYVHRYLRGRVRRGEIDAGTAANYWSSLSVLVETFGARPPGRLGERDVERWREARAAVLQPSTMCTQWSELSCFLDWLVANNVIRRNPCRSMPAPRRPRSVPRALDEDEIAAILEVAPDRRARAIVWLKVGMGLRACEVSRARVEHWSRRDELLLVCGKGGHEREVPVIDEARHALEDYLVEYPASSGPLIRSYYQPHRGIRPSTLSHYLSAWCWAAGVKHAPYDGVSGHALRHTCASDVLDECGDLRAVQELLGHEHLSSTSIYLRRLRMGELRVAMEGRSYRKREETPAPGGGGEGLDARVIPLESANGA